MKGGNAAKTHTEARYMVVDSGTTAHIVKDRSVLTEVKQMRQPKIVHTANNGSVEMKESGNAHVQGIDGNVKLSDVRVAEEFSVNLFSVTKWLDEAKERKIVMVQDGVTGYERDKPVMNGERVDDLYVLPLEMPKDSAYLAETRQQEKQVKVYKDLHCVLGHMGKTLIAKIIANDSVRGLDEWNLPRIDILKAPHIIERCEDCEMSKAQRRPFAKNSSRLPAREPMNRLFVDLSGKIRNRGNGKVFKALGSIQYVSVIVDEKSRFVVGKLLKNKDSDSVVEHVKCFIRFGENQTGFKVKYIHSDGGGEYDNSKLKDFCRHRGIEIEITLPYTPQNNGIVEIKMRTIFSYARAMLYHAKLDYAFWPMAVFCAIYLINYRIVGDEGKSAFENFYLVKPSIRHLRKFGCDCYVQIQVGHRFKLEPRAVKCIFLGYAPQHDGAWIFYHIEENKVIYSRDAVFEDRFTFGREKGLRVDYSTVNPRYLDELLDDATSEENDVKENDRERLYDMRENKDSHKPEGNAQNNNAITTSIVSRESDHQNVYDEKDDDVEEIKRIEVDEEVSFRSDRDNVPERKDIDTEHKEQKENESSRILRHVQRNEEKKAEKPKSRSNKKKPNQTSVSSIISSAKRVKANYVGDDHAYLAYTNDLPRNYKEAMQRPDAEKWKEAIEVEMKNLQDNKVYEVVKREQASQNDKNVLKTRWVFTIKMKDDGTIDKYKARFVACGYSQEYGVDFEETFAPVGKYKTLRILLALTNILDYEIKQMDVVSAFLNAELNEVLFIEQPDGLTEGHDCVWKLKKAIYGTKQAPHEWNKEINKYLVSSGFKRLSTDTCVYSRITKNGNYVFLFVFVDDIIIAYHRSDESEWSKYKNNLMNRYKMKDLGDVKWLLGMRVRRNREKKEILLDQQQYIAKKVDEFNMKDSKPCTTPEERGIVLNIPTDEELEKEQEKVKDLPYRKLVGSMLYAAIGTRPDIAHAVQQISKYNNKYTTKHWLAGKRIIRYLNTTNEETCLKYSGVGGTRSVKLDDKDIRVNLPNISIDAYCDADWGGDRDDRKSTTGWIIKLNNNTISWLVKKQQTVAISSAEAEYMAIASVAQEVIWIKQFLSELFYVSMDHLLNKCVIHTDNMSALAISKNDVHHERTKHIDIKYHFIREGLTHKVYEINWISTTEQLADIFTKAIHGPQFTELSNAVLGSNL